MELNKEQKHAVAAMCTVSRGRKPLALFGPPGTGKTVTLVEMVLQLLALDSSHRLLVCAPQNFTCDVFCKRLLEASVDPGTVLRLIDPRWPANRVVRFRASPSAHAWWPGHPPHAAHAVQAFSSALRSRCILAQHASSRSVHPHPRPGQ